MGYFLHKIKCLNQFPNFIWNFFLKLMRTPFSLTILGSFLSWKRRRYIILTRSTTYDIVNFVLHVVYRTHAPPKGSGKTQTNRVFPTWLRQDQVGSLVITSWVDGNNSLPPIHKSPKTWICDPTFVSTVPLGTHAAIYSPYEKINQPISSKDWAKVEANRALGYSGLSKKTG
jgi:hypothetical protein